MVKGNRGIFGLMLKTKSSLTLVIFVSSFVQKGADNKLPHESSQIPKSFNYREETANAVSHSSLKDAIHQIPDSRTRKQTKR